MLIECCLCAGGTVFPAIGSESQLRPACRKIMQSGTGMITNAGLDVGVLRDERKQLIHAANLVARDEKAPHSTGVVSPARRGAVLLFYTINDLGGNAPWTRWQREAMAWHGGVDVLPGGQGKWIMQKFKELPIPVRGNANEVQCE